MIEALGVGDRVNDRTNRVDNKVSEKGVNDAVKN